MWRIEAEMRELPGGQHAIHVVHKLFVANCAPQTAFKYCYSPHILIRLKTVFTTLNGDECTVDLVTGRLAQSNNKRVKVLNRLSESLSLIRDISSIITSSIFSTGLKVAPNFG
jgi:hypothetical protein